MHSKTPRANDWPTVRTQWLEIYRSVADRGRAQHQDRPRAKVSGHSIVLNRNLAAPPKSDGQTDPHLSSCKIEMVSYGGAWPLGEEGELVVQTATPFRRSARDVPIHFLHIRKTGGTALTEALGPIAQEFGIVLHAHNTKLSDIPQDHRVFFFVRHPISRFVSGFFSRLRRGRPRYNYEWSEAEAKAFGRFVKPNDLAEALSASDAETRTCAREAMRGVAHLNSPYRDWFSGEQELEDRLDSILLIGLQERLSADFEHLKELLDLPPKLSLPEDDVLAHRTPREFNRQLTPLAERNLSNWYAEDIRFYDRCLKLRGLHAL